VGNLYEDRPLQHYHDVHFFLLTLRRFLASFQSIQYLMCQVLSGWNHTRDPSLLTLGIYASCAVLRHAWRSLLEVTTTVVVPVHQTTLSGDLLLVHSVE
jgi:hypothetical protein